MNASHFSPDTLEFLRLLALNKVQYVIVGGEAVIYYGYARLTGDVDFFYESTSGNSQRLFNALHEFWEGNIPGVKSFIELQSEGTILQFGQPPNRIDLINRIDGVTFDEAWKSRIENEIEWENQRISVFYIGLSELIKNKESIRRGKDLEDLKYLKSSKENLKK